MSIAECDFYYFGKNQVHWTCKINQLKVQNVKSHDYIAANIILLAFDPFHMMTPVSSTSFLP